MTWWTDLWTPKPNILSSLGADSSGLEERSTAPSDAQGGVGTRLFSRSSREASDVASFEDSEVVNRIPRLCTDGCKSSQKTLLIATETRVPAHLWRLSDTSKSRDLAACTSQVVRTETFMDSRAVVFRGHPVRFALSAFSGQNVCGYRLYGLRSEHIQPVPILSRVFSRRNPARFTLGPPTSGAVSISAVSST